MSNPDYQKKIFDLDLLAHSFSFKFKDYLRGIQFFKNIQEVMQNTFQHIVPLYEAEKLDSGQIPDILVKFEKAEKNFMENIGDHLQLMNNAYVFSGYFKTNLKKEQKIY